MFLHCKLVTVLVEKLKIFSWNSLGYLKNRQTNTRLVCSLNLEMRIQIIRNFLKKSLKIVDIHSAILPLLNCMVKKLELRIVPLSVLLYKISIWEEEVAAKQKHSSRHLYDLLEKVYFRSQILKQWNMFIGQY